MDTIEINNKLYQRKPWRGHTFALILLGEYREAYDDKGEVSGREYVPIVRKSATTDPLKASKARTKAPKAEKKAPQIKPKKAEGKPNMRR
jgi:hypothetical protein